MRRCAPVIPRVSAAFGGSRSGDGNTEVTEGHREDTEDGDRRCRCASNSNSNSMKHGEDGADGEHGVG